MSLWRAALNEQPQRQNQREERPETDPAPRFRSGGINHSKMVKFGIQKAAFAKMSQVTQAHNNDRLGLVRSVFGQWQQKAASSGIYKSQNKVVFNAGAGAVDCFDYVSNQHASLARQKGIGIWSHLCSQRSKVLEWFQKKNAVCATAPLTDFRIFYYYIVLDRDLIQGGLNQN